MTVDSAREAAASELLRTDLEPVPWYASLTVRLTLFLLAAQLASLWLLPALYRWSLEHFGLPTEGATIVMPHDLAGSAPGGAALQGRAQSIFVAERLLNGAQQEAEGRWVPTSEACALIEEELTPQSQGFAWLSADRRIVAISKNQPWSVGDMLEFPFLGEEPAIAHDYPDFWVGSVFAPVHKQGRLAGWLVLLHAYRDRTYSVADVSGSEPTPRQTFRMERVATIEMDQEELDAAASRQRLMATGASILGVMIIALSASFVVSRLIARRLSVLARQVAVPFEHRADLPGPFNDSGNDEVALLARAMNLTRNRANFLLERLTEREGGHRKWVAQVSHDLRTPLTALIATLDRADSVIERAKAELAKAQSGQKAVDPSSFCGSVGDLLHVMRIDAERVNALADDLLDIARLGSEAQLTKEPVPPGELVRHAVTEFGPMAQKAELRLSGKATPGLPILSADGHLLLRALENMLRNALRHARTQVELVASGQRDCVRFEVRDDGPGFRSTNGVVDLEQLANRRERAGSAGLGLVVVRRVAEMHQGQVGANNAPEGGGVVWFEIPVEEESDTDDTQAWLARQPNMDDDDDD